MSRDKLERDERKKINKEIEAKGKEEEKKRQAEAELRSYDRVMNEGNLLKGIDNYSDAAQSVVQVHFLVPTEHKTSNNHATFMNQKVVTRQVKVL